MKRAHAGQMTLPTTEPTKPTKPAIGLDEARAQFSGGRGYVAACTLGRPNMGTLAAMWAMTRGHLAMARP